MDYQGEVQDRHVTKYPYKSETFLFVRKAVKRHGWAEAIVTDRQTYKLRRSAALAEWQNLMA